MRQRLGMTLLLLSIITGQVQAQRATLDHVAIQVKDVAVSAAFYRDAFGMEELAIPFKGVPIPVKWIDLGDGVALHIVGGRTEPVMRPKWDHLAVAFGNMEATIARLDAKGIKWASMDGKKTPQVRPDGVKQIFVQDPDGYWIEINDKP